MAQFDQYTDMLDTDVATSDVLGIWDTSANQFKNITTEEFRQWVINNSSIASDWASLTGKPTTVAGFGITDAYTNAQTDAAISVALAALVDAAPGTLDTLNELAAALGDDANFASTMTTALAGKAATSHTHAEGDVTGLTAALAGKAASSHTHAEGDVTGLTAALAGKAATSHTHTEADITDLGAYLLDAPNDGSEYVRKNAAWAVATGGGGGGGVPAGGVANDILVKQSGVDGDVAWEPLLTNPTISQTITAKEKIATVTNDTAGEVVFTVPAGYDRLTIVCSARSNTAADADEIYLYLNTDFTAANYHRQITAAYNAGNVSSEAAVPMAGSIVGATGLADTYTDVTIEIADPDGGQLKQGTARWMSHRIADAIYVGQSGFVSAITAPITTITLRTDNHPTDGLLGTYILYGEKEVEVAASTYLAPASATINAEELIEEVTVTAGAVSFVNIPSGYTDLIIRGSAQSTVASTVDIASLYFNNDTTDANYFAQISYHTGTTTAPSEGAVSTLLALGGATATEPETPFDIVIPGYTDGARKRASGKSLVLMDDAQYRVYDRHIIHDTLTAAITRIDIQSPTASITGIFRLYGRKEVAIPGSDRVVPAATIVAKEKIATITLDTAGEFDFNNIPAGYDKLYIEGRLQSNQGGVTYDKAYVYLNEDLSNANYYSQLQSGNNNLGEHSEAAAPSIGYVATPTSATPYSALALSIEGYATVSRKFIQVRGSFEYDSGAIADSSLTVRSALTDAVTRVRVRTDNHPTQQLTGTLTLYGEKEVEVAASNYQAPGTQTLIAKEKIAELTNTVAGEFDFTIPAGYDRIIIEGYGRSSGSGDADHLYMFLNDDLTVANYHNQYVRGANSASATAAEAATPFIGTLSASTSVADAYTQISATIEAPDSTNKKGAMSFSSVEYNTDAMVFTTTAYSSSVTAAITRIRLRTDNHPTDGITGKFTVYGEKEVEVAGSDRVVPSATITAKEKIATITNTTAGGFEFTSIPAGYDRLILEATVRQTTDTSVMSIYTYLNGNTTDTNYHYTQVRGADTAAAGGEGDFPFVGYAATTYDTTSRARITIVIENPDDSAAYLEMVSDFAALLGNDAQRVGKSFVSSNIAGPLTSLEFVCPTSGMVGEVTLYGEREVEVAASNYQAPGTETIFAKQLIAEVTNAIAGEFDFTIPAGYDKLVIEGSIASSEATLNDVMYLFLNEALTVGDYHCQLHWVAAGANNSPEYATPQIGWVVGSTADGDNSTFRIEIDQPDGAQDKTARGSFGGYYGADNALVGSSIVYSGITAALTRIRLRADGHSANGLTGTVRVYGEKQVTVAGSDAEAVTMEAMIPIQTITNLSAAPFNFTSIPAGYKRLVIKGRLQSPVVATSGDGYVYLNGDLTEANYHRQFSAGNNAAAHVTEAVNPIFGVICGSTSGAYSQVELSIDNYDAAGVYKIVDAHTATRKSSNDMFVGDSTVTAASLTAAVTAVRVTTVTQGDLLGELTLYGVEDVAVNSVLAEHDHAIADVTGLQAALDAKAASSHSHAISDTTGLQTALDAKAASSHSHAISDTTGLQTALDAKAPINNATMTGTTEVSSLKIGAWTISVVSGTLVFNNGSDRMELSSTGKLSVTGDVESGATL